MLNKFHMQTGATLIEAMVSLFVLAIGALGLAALQTTAIVQTDDNKQRTLAIWKAQELADRMTSSMSAGDTDGIIDRYIDEIGNSGAPPANGIGVYNATSTYSCPAAPGTDCSTTSCGKTKIVRYDLWDVLCDPQTGLSTTDSDSASVGLQNMEVALRRNGVNYELYIEWLARSADRETADADLGLSGTVETSLCGNTVNMDVRVDAYCLRFQ